MGFDLTLEDWDIHASDNDLVMNKGNESLAQDVAVSIKMWKTDNIYSAGSGQPWLNVFTKTSNVSVVRDIIEQDARSRAGIRDASIIWFTLNHNKRLFMSLLQIVFEQDDTRKGSYVFIK